MMKVLNENLERWRDQLGVVWGWDDDNHQCNHINEARMRGKYYGAKYVIHRPALQYALKVACSPQQRNCESSDPLIIQAAQTCISAAIRSTTVFDRIPERLIVTNIFDTARA
jgi:hypothetical protein